MTSKRKAELQRKLSMTSVPRPPAGLSERLKADIPQNLMSTERDRERFRRSSLWSIRVAASVIVLVTSAYLALHFVSRNEQSAKFDATPPSLETTRKVAAAAPPQSEVTITLADNDKDVNSGRVAEVAPAIERPHPARVERDELQKKERAQIADANEPSNRVSKLDERRAEAADAQGAPVAAREASAVPMAPPAAPPAMARANTARMAAKTEQSIAVTAAAPSIITSANADTLSLEPPHVVFGLSVDKSVFARVKQELERGNRPSPQTRDVSALINYFSESARAPRHDLRLDVEASRTPLSNDNSALLRFTIDTPREEIAAGGSTPPVATDASLDITLNSEAVTSHRLIGAEQLEAQSTLFKNTSVTGLMDVKLKEFLSPHANIATLRLRYRSVADGKMHTITREVHASDVQRNWASASKRHRLPTLGAAWSESLSEGSGACDIARTADKLATENPGDPRAKDLAAVANASCRLRSSGPTGSGR